MANEIINRVANSKLVNLDLELLYPKGERLLLDISSWLYKGIVLKEQDFRAYINNYDWSRYQNTYVAIHCSADAIIPSWAYMLVSLALSPYAKKVVLGNLNTLESVIFYDIITTLPLDPYRDKAVIVKGCSKKPIPDVAYAWVCERLKPVVKSLMYGEACSSVPLYKRK